MGTRQIAEVFPPGDFIREELECRGWTQGDLAEIMDKSQRLVSEVISGKRGLTPETAKGLSMAFDTSAEYWMNLESGFQLSKVEDQCNEIERRARLFEMFPVKDMVRRHWIEHSQNLDVFETRFKEFFVTKELNERPKFQSYAASKSETADTDSSNLNAWLFRTRQLAKSMAAVPYTEKGLKMALEDLRAGMAEHEFVMQVSDRLAEAGVRLVVVEPFPGMKVDGVCYWLAVDSPVVALSLRMDRIDNFWFVLMHELRHVANGDNLAVDVDLRQGCDESMADCPEFEIRANREAAEVILGKNRLQDFIRSTSPAFSAKKIEEFAASENLHPGIVVGQLHHARKVPFSHHRKQLVKIRDLVTSATITDGWGRVAD